VDAPLCFKVFLCVLEVKENVNTAIKLIRVRVIMTSANCSPAVASRRAKYVDDFQVPMLLGEKDRIIFFSGRGTSLFPMAVLDYTQLFQRGGWHHQSVCQIPEIYVQPSSEIC
jgi:hypothetical protein